MPDPRTPEKPPTNITTRNDLIHQIQQLWQVNPGTPEEEVKQRVSRSIELVALTWLPNAINPQVNTDHVWDLTNELKAPPDIQKYLTANLHQLLDQNPQSSEPLLIAYCFSKDYSPATSSKTWNEQRDDRILAAMKTNLNPQANGEIPAFYLGCQTWLRQEFCNYTNDYLSKMLPAAPDFELETLQAVYQSQLALFFGLAEFDTTHGFVSDQTHLTVMKEIFNCQQRDQGIDFALELAKRVQANQMPATLEPEVGQSLAIRASQALSQLHPTMVLLSDPKINEVLPLFENRRLQQQLSDFGQTGLIALLTQTGRLRSLLSNVNRLPNPDRLRAYRADLDDVFTVLGPTSSFASLREPIAILQEWTNNAQNFYDAYKTYKDTGVGNPRDITHQLDQLCAGVDNTPFNQLQTDLQSLIAKRDQIYQKFTPETPFADIYKNRLRLKHAYGPDPVFRELYTEAIIDALADPATNINHALLRRELDKLSKTDTTIVQRILLERTRQLIEPIKSQLTQATTTGNWAEVYDNAAKLAEIRRDYEGGGMETIGADVSAAIDESISTALATVERKQARLDIEDRLFFMRTSHLSKVWSERAGRYLKAHNYPEGNLDQETFTQWPDWLTQGGGPEIDIYLTRYTAPADLHALAAICDCCPTQPGETSHYQRTKDIRTMARTRAKSIAHDTTQLVLDTQNYGQLVGIWHQLTPFVANGLLDPSYDFATPYDSFLQELEDSLRQALPSSSPDTQQLRILFEERLGETPLAKLPPFETATQLVGWLDALPSLQNRADLIRQMSIAAEGPTLTIYREAHQQLLQQIATLRLQGINLDAWLETQKINTKISGRLDNLLITAGLTQTVGERRQLLSADEFALPRSEAQTAQARQRLQEILAKQGKLETASAVAEPTVAELQAHYAALTTERERLEAMIPITRQAITSLRKQLTTLEKEQERLQAAIKTAIAPKPEKRKDVIPPPETSPQPTVTFKKTLGVTFLEFNGDLSQLEARLNATPDELDNLPTKIMFKGKTYSVKTEGDKIKLEPMQ